MRCWVESGEVWVAKERGIVWHGRPDGYPAQSLVECPSSEDCVVLLDAATGPRNPIGDQKGWPNLVRVSAYGVVVWRAEAGSLPGEKDWWVSVTLRDGRIEAQTFGGYRKTLDPDSGRVVSAEFVK